MFKRDKQAGPKVLSKTLLSNMQRLVITEDEVILGKQRVPLAGARAEVTADKSGVFGRTSASVFTVESPDGQQLVYTYGGGFGTKGAASRSELARLHRLAGAVNRFAAQAAAGV
jgi:hypothetical protein